jgi:hypothetical protein
MTSAEAWDLFFRRDDLTASEVRPSVVPPLGAGEVRLAVERLAITNSTACYARLRDSPMRFLDVFPAPKGLARVPAWGFARVVESRHPRVMVGGRYFGFLPMSTCHVIRPDVVDGGLFDATPGRDFLHDWYRVYETATPHELDDRKALLHPLFPASFTLAEFVAEQRVVDVLITSASSKVAIGLAEELRRRGGVRTIGITSVGHEPFVTGLGRYDCVICYDGISRLAGERQAMLVDLTNSVELIKEVYRVIAGRLAATVLVGFTHPRVITTAPALADPVPLHFFAPAMEQSQIRREGGQSYRLRYEEAESRFVAGSAAWLAVRRGHGPVALADTLHLALSGDQPPTVGDIVYLADGDDIPAGRVSLLHRADPLHQPAAGAASPGTR